MWRTNLKIGLTVVGTLAVYTVIANVIPQVESDVPEVVEIGSDVTPAQLVSLGEELFEGAGGCTACHGTGTRAPDVLGVAGTECEARVPEMTCKEYLYESMVDPGAYVVEGFQPIMPDMRRTLSEGQIWALVAFLQDQGGEVTVTADDIPEGENGGTGAAAGEAFAEEEPVQPGDAPGETGEAAASGSGTPSPGAGAPELMRAYGCVACHALEGEGAPVGPSVDEIRGADHDPGYVRRGILSPDADTAAGYEAFAGTMPPDFGSRLTAGELETLVDYLTGEP